MDTAPRSGLRLPARPFTGFTTNAPNRRPVLCEALERRMLLAASISGTVIGLNGLPVAGLIVFHDLNQNGQLNAGEQNTTTDANGAYVLADLANGNYHIAVQPTSTLAELGSGRDVNFSGTLVPNVGLAVVAQPLAAGTPGAELSATFASTLPAAVIGGAKGKLTLLVTNNGSADASGPMDVTLFASSDGILADGSVITTAHVKVKLKAGKSKKIKLKFAFPSTLADGSYTIFAGINSSGSIAETDTSNDAVTGPVVTIAAPFVDLTSTLTAPAAIREGKSAKVSLRVTNNGNDSAKGPILIELSTSASPSGGSPQQLVTFTKKISIKAGKSKVLKLKLPTSLAAGTYFIVSTINADNALTESTLSNNTAVSANALVVS